MKTIHMFLGLSALLVLLLLAGACATSTQSATKGPELAASPPSATAAPAQTPDDGVPRIKPAEAIAEVKAGKAILVDVRDTSSYDIMHAKGAINVTYQSISEGKFDKLPKDKHLIFYCTWPSEHSSAGSAAILKGKGYTNVSALLGGLYGYKDAGGEVEAKDAEPKK